jgi:hypothetical protein
MDTGAPFDRFSSPGKPAIAKDIQENGFSSPGKPAIAKDIQENGFFR